MGSIPSFYETLYITRPDIQSDELETIQKKLDEAIISNSGEILKSDKWAERDLAYEINKHTKGVYYIMIFQALPQVVADMEKHLSFYKNDILRFMTVKIKEEVARRESAVEEEKVEEKTEEKAKDQVQAPETQAPQPQTQPEAQSAEPAASEEEAKPQEQPTEPPPAEPEVKAEAQSSEPEAVEESTPAPETTTTDPEEGGAQ